MSETKQLSSSPYKIFRRLPPFYTLQPNLQSQAKQTASWNDFILDVALTAFHQTGTLGIQVTPHSALFKSPKEVNRVLGSTGARSVLKVLAENEVGNRCLPLPLEDDSENDALNKTEEEDVANDENDDDDDDFEGVAENQSKSHKSTATIFANCDALVVLPLPCEQIVKSIWEWHSELQTSNVFSVTEIAEDEDIKKRITKKVMSLGRMTNSNNQTPPLADVGAAILGETIICDGTTSSSSSSSNSAIHVTPLTAETVIETIMTTEHPAMSHMKRPGLLSGSSGSLGLKFG